MERPQAMVQEHEIGKRIREFRKKQGLGLQNLAAATGFTKGYLSKVEKSAKSPPVSTLIIIANALKVSLSEILGEEKRESKISLVKKDQRHEMARSGSAFGYSYQTLAHIYAQKHMEPFILTLPRKPKKNPLFQHTGEEILFVLEGTMKFFYGNEEFIVEEGDCIYFNASIPHYGISQGDKEVKCFMVIYNPSGVI